MLDFALSVLMLAVVALLLAAFVLWRRGVRKQAALMVLLALIGIANVLIWTIPDAEGLAPAERLPQTSDAPG